jgi:hypothetical protein
MVTALYCDMYQGLQPCESTIKRNVEQLMKA